MSPPLGSGGQKYATPNKCREGIIILPMKRSIQRSLVLASGASLLLLSSCNRGFGCPTNLSLDGFVSGLLALIS